MAIETAVNGKATGANPGGDHSAATNSAAAPTATPAKPQALDPAVLIRSATRCLSGALRTVPHGQREQTSDVG